MAINNPGINNQIKELDKKIIKRPKDINIIQECIAIADIYSIYIYNKQVKLSGDNRFYARNRDDDETPLFCNKTLAAQCGLNKRNYLIRKIIGRNINRSLITTIINYPQLNKLKFLYKLAQHPKDYQNIILKKAVDMINGE